MVFLLSFFLLLSAGVLCNAQNATGNTTFDPLGFADQDYNLTTVDIQYQVYTGCGPTDNLTTVSRRVAYVVQDGLALIDGDIVYGTEDDIIRDTVPNLPARDFAFDHDKRALSVRDTSSRWPDAILPYSFNPADVSAFLSDTAKESRKQLFRDAAQVWMDRLPWLQIVERTDAYDLGATTTPDRITVSLIPGLVSWSPVGRAFSQVSSVISLGADDLGVYVHELGHSIGLHHEQKRPDRDQFFNLDCSRIEDRNGVAAKCASINDCEGWGCAFAPLSDSAIYNFEGPYDTSSIMHYFEGAFGKDPAFPPLTGINSKVFVGTGYRPTVIDAIRVCEMYQQQCRGVCGDGIYAPGNGEECDPGCDEDSAFCGNDCKFRPGCGNGIVDPGEACDDGLLGSATCTSSCTLVPVCGNGVVEDGEECDDGAAGSATCDTTCHTIAPCVQTCDPNPNNNACDITTSCIAIEGGSVASQGKHFCACRAGFRADLSQNQIRLPWYSPVSQEGRVFVEPGQACNILCNDFTLGRDGCREVDEQPMCY